MVIAMVVNLINIVMGILSYCTPSYYVYLHEGCSTMYLIAETYC